MLTSLPSVTLVSLVLAMGALAPRASGLLSSASAVALAANRVSSGIARVDFMDFSFLLAGGSESSFCFKVE